MKNRIVIVLLILTTLAFVGWGASSLFAIHEDFNPQPSCVNVKVKEILALNYRDADILLENGAIMSVNQATLKPGDTVCYQDNAYNIKKKATTH